jgi:hypothetical protein
LCADAVSLLDVTVSDCFACESDVDGRWMSWTGRLELSPVVADCNFSSSSEGTCNLSSWSYEAKTTNGVRWRNLRQFQARWATCLFALQFGCRSFFL